MTIKKQQKTLQNINNLMPAIIQHVKSGEILMLGYMNEKAIQITKESGYVTFFSRKKKCLWTKGETSGNKLKFINLFKDCDQDSLLILALPYGPTCHNGTSSCFYPANSSWSFLFKLEELVNKRKLSNIKNSYTVKLFTKGSKWIAQKVGEEAIETILASVTKNKEEIIDESADLLYHLLVLLQDQSLDLSKVIDKLKIRHNS
ncbi:bifunctional phosphoribosyl-AMP cyclohydrolase/phosphoribosyl-ATP diphosphatase HisIE [Blochmannia endosymbiont of Camponotus (Colobopsis) obliquus]|uniref:bifunctional phosphoribosyl-AMP cyclohydrolase/phosphoribosyl-ATP diphosphatase HisIE n=1 Tax=Blochmannia endosymbiont of Camponotus (Colobopsis) obliquus TaxID=1505597 RepID=UPI00061A7347|nr:bifunctional phosphoribosyl-AMP cyclohydrolase/phosphoribosyl-ATP diphosphatase HisIE [Blochmannia endosymbiont of Camponotus (Colobopsis) obliquus]AKC60621.1 Histidine biosynthesis bifunctional protein HisIE [Blochmannia endosymbiont of Camponotus (Colobopsis) obliquus]